MEKNRLEAFSDGVLAIIITIMILELKQPLGDRLSDFWALWPTLLAYLISFLFIAIYWVNHHLIFQLAEKVNIKILWCNIAWLFVMSFIPFATAWVGTYPTAWAPLSIYFADMFLASVTFHQMYYLILHEGGQKFKWTLRGVISLITYFLATTLGGFCPSAAFIIVAVVSCWWIFPAKKKG
ncbi:MAG: TMEM175 family protein [Clostridiales bacterium]|nr:TMEM175 family protein [Clostridiales bacterium]